MSDEAVSALQTSYAVVAKDLLSPVLHLFDIVHELFDGDFELFHIIGVIAARSADHPAMAEIAISSLENGDMDIPSLHTNARSVAASTGIPVETVRRKVLQLIDKGWISRNDHLLAFTPAGAQALTPVRQALIDQAAANYKTVSQLRRGAA